MGGSGEAGRRSLPGAEKVPVLGAVAAPTALLIRDGYVAWVRDGTNPSLRDALTTWFGPPTLPQGSRVHSEKQEIMRNWSRARPDRQLFGRHDMTRLTQLIPKLLPLSFLSSLAGCIGPHITQREVLSVTGGGSGESWIVVHEVEGERGREDAQKALNAPRARGAEV
jgi:hypothetical protein